MNFSFEQLVIRTRVRMNFYQKTIPYFFPSFYGQNDVKFLNQSKPEVIAIFRFSSSNTRHGHGLDAWESPRDQS